MHKYISIILFSFIFVPNAFAENTLAAETKDWKPVMIDVDSSNNTYKVMGKLPADPTEKFYYAFEGFRCFPDERNNMTIDPVIIRNATSSQTLYCYPEQ